MIDDLDVDDEDVLDHHGHVKVDNVFDHHIIHKSQLADDGDDDDILIIFTATITKLKCRRSLLGSPCWCTSPPLFSLSGDPLPG